MSLTEKLFNKFGYTKRKNTTFAFKRGYNAAKLDNLTYSWAHSNITADGELKKSLKILRGRARDLSYNNDYFKKFLLLLKSNVIGSNGIRLQNKAKDSKGNIDTEVNEIIEEGFREWSKKGTCTVCGQYSLIDVDKIVLETMARDGEVLIYMVRGFKNKYRFALQLIEADHLDEDLNVPMLSNGNIIRMGIEFNNYNRPIAYHLLTKHPGDYLDSGRNHNRILAENIIHLHEKARFTQSRGVTWGHTGMGRNKMLEGFIEASVTGARVGASNMGFLVPGADSEYGGDDKDEKGNIIRDAEPGTFEVLPGPGWDLKQFDPKQPVAEFGNFNKGMLRGIASGLGVSYNSLASDLEGVNFSSIRQGVLDDRDLYKMIQTFYITSKKIPVYSNWLDMALLSGVLKTKSGLPLPYEYKRLNQPKFCPRGWSWVDPLKDQKANESEWKMFIKPLAHIAAERGLDLEDLFQAYEYERGLAEKYGIPYDDKIFEKMANTMNAATETEEDENGQSNKN